MNTRSDNAIDKETEVTAQQCSVITKSQSELYLALKKWHQKAVGNLDTILGHQDADLDFGDDLKIKAGTNKAKGFHAGIMVARHYLGGFPDFQFTDGTAEVESDGE